MFQIDTLNETLGSLPQLVMNGGIIYLFVDKFILSKRQKVEVKADVIGNGTRVVDLYKEIDTIVELKTKQAVKPLEDKIDQLQKSLLTWGCYRPTDECGNRLSVPPSPTHSSTNDKQE